MGGPFPEERQSHVIVILVETVLLQELDEWICYRDPYYFPE